MGASSTSRLSAPKQGVPSAALTMLPPRSSPQPPQPFKCSQVQHHAAQSMHMRCMASCVGHLLCQMHLPRQGGLLSLTKTLARDLGPDGITVNAVAPGQIDTARPGNDGPLPGSRCLPNPPVCFVRACLILIGASVVHLPLSQGKFGATYCTEVISVSKSVCCCCPMPARL